MNKQVVLGALLTSLALASFAQTPAPTWKQEHPRRAEVNQRLAKQNQRIKHESKQGEISPSQAAALHQEGQQIRHEEQTMASLNGGHITKAGQKALNQQDNAVSQQIGG